MRIFGSINPLTFLSTIVLCLNLSGIALAQDDAQPEKTVDETSETPLEREYRELLELDDAALTEVDDWIRKANQTQDGVNDPQLINLPSKIEQRLKPVRKAYEEFILKHPEHVGVRLAYASFLTDRGDEIDAVPHLKKATELDPKNPAAWNNLGNYYGHMGPVKKAFECYEKAIRFNPNAAVYYHNYGTTVYLFRKDAKEHFGISEDEIFDKALELYAIALKKDPNNFDLAEDIAQTYYGIRTKVPPRKMARPKEALEAWDYALKIAPGENEKQGVYIHKARILLGMDQVGAAKEALDQVKLPIYQELKNRILGNVNQRTEEILPPATLR